MIPVKICGITSIRDGLLAATRGASAVGLIFYENSPRYISPTRAKEISQNLPREISKVGVFVNSGLSTIHRVANDVGLDFVQLHGDESPEFCSQVGLPVIKALRIHNNIRPENYDRFPVHALLLDSYKRGVFGGTGSPFDWSLTQQIKTYVPVILSGGLNASNILEAISVSQPDAVDISSGVESGPGIKDSRKLSQLFQVLKKTGDYPKTWSLTRDGNSQNG